MVFYVIFTAAKTGMRYGNAEGLCRIIRQSTYVTATFYKVPALRFAPCLFAPLSPSFLTSFLPVLVSPATFVAFFAATDAVFYVVDRCHAA
jgi:hypothetical protein